MLKFCCVVGCNHDCSFDCAIVLWCCNCSSALWMPTVDKRRKRAIAADEADGAAAARSLLASRNLSKQTLKKLTGTLRTNPELVSRSIDAHEAAGASIYESVRRSELVDMKEAPCLSCFPFCIIPAPTHHSFFEDSPPLLFKLALRSRHSLF